jgi:hypothetical protein
MYQKNVSKSVPGNKTSQAVLRPADFAKFFQTWLNQANFDLSSPKISFPIAHRPKSLLKHITFMNESG